MNQADFIYSSEQNFKELPERIHGLGELAENLWWSWHPAARMLYKLLDRHTWKRSGHNPDKTLRELPPEKLEGFSKDAAYLRHYDVVISQFQRYLAPRSCDLLATANNGDPSIAYFSAEYGLHHSLPFYAGGLGFLAGDYLKECSDLNIPLIAVGFMYPGGYVRQRIREDGWQENVDETLDREAASIARVLDAQGRQVVVKVPLIEPPIHVGVWRVAVGRVSLFLLDTDIESNDPWNRGICTHLYSGDQEQRLRQEIVLGIGGSEMLETLGIQHTLLHLNEGHAAFAILERIRDRVQAGASYEEALSLVRDTTVFTTHTPVPAGHDVFPFHLMEKYFSTYWTSLGLDHDRFLQLGVHPDDPYAGFNMTAFALRAAGRCNAVSRRHGLVARRMWHALWPGLSVEDVPIDYVTNGVHVPTWIEPKMELLFNRYLGPDWLKDHDDPFVWELINEIPDEELWKTHYWLKIKLLTVIRERARRRWAQDHTSPSIILACGALLDPAILTFGFARRFATYKRADLILFDPEQLRKLVNDPLRPIQIIFAGKAHPADDPGKRVLQEVVHAARDPELGGRIAFLEDYGEQLAQYMVHGVDVWLNNPMPPLEASGTSGMKAALNGVPQLSIRDGWWLEGFNGENGWAFGPEEGPPAGDAEDAAALYRIIAEEIVPAYYQLDEDGVPHRWVRIMKSAVKRSAAQFSARRMAKQYIHKFYLPSLRKGNPGSSPRGAAGT